MPRTAEGGDAMGEASRDAVAQVVCQGEQLEPDERLCRGRLGRLDAPETVRSALHPAEDALANVAIDLSGRPFCVYDVKYTSAKIGDFDVECIEEFLRSFANHGKFNLHISVPHGTNSHHIAEAIFKGIGQSLMTAIKITGTEIPSTKGVL